ncbi:hypothetical protein H7992_22455 [Sporosarcina sp. resist]|uniref:hypothetical protein n=1 Tax=Sporosarcina sp. resist TaxID=2762563 RepID=UPI00164EB09B|nr:hypothetical protein [Sporosarcina sp. resist]QNK87887.1 hypothetical protein H7992_22455 [Sporosarcina sp. resist]
MSALKRDAITFFKVLIYLAIGFILTENVLGVIYEDFGISFMGNVWVNWFGLSYLLYFFYTIIRVLFTNENNQLFKKRMKSKVFWVLFIVSAYVVFIPFIKGINPF